MKRLIGLIVSLAMIAGGLYQMVFTLNTKLWMAVMGIGAILLFIVTFFTGPDWEDRPWYGKILRILGIIATCVVLSGVIGAALFMINPLGNDEGRPIADVKEHINIWGNVIPGNDLVSKMDYMEVDSEPPVPVARLRFEKAVASDKYADVLNIIDTYTYTHGIEGEYDSILYNDEPFVIPYVVEGSSDAVLIIPGGGYAIRSNEGKDDEGAVIAKALNERGISAFVLWYRANPYPAPIAEMDLQRGVRWVRAHADSYGYSADNVSLLGFGAGGNLAAAYINKYMGTSLLPEGYTGDGTDGASDRVAGAAMIYPFMNYYKNVPLLFAHYNSETVRSVEERTALLEETDLTKQFNSADIRQFVSYGTKDRLVPPDSARDYIEAARGAGAEVTEHTVDQGHYYGTEDYLDAYMAWLKPSAAPAEEPAEQPAEEASETTDGE
ncbi:MAG: alpha/beta hydrolase [Erysipelotrichaceae bacterium]|nr:alpha/beta hydrolase [Erysipelotrichaceae bacterium]